MKMMLQNIREWSEALLADGQRQNDTGNKAAGRRARKASLELEKILKDNPRLFLKPRPHEHRPS